MDNRTQVIYEELKRVAMSGSTTNYTDVGVLIGLDMNSPADRNEIATILDSISNFEHARGNPLLSAVVLLKDKNMPGNGFFSLAKRLSKQKGEEDLDFWLSELRLVHNTWPSQA